MSVPLHPAIVHLPLALALLVPVGALAVTWLAWRRGPSRTLVGALVVAQVLLVGSGIVATRLGEADEERVEAIVPEAALESHEERAETFVIVGAVVLGALVVGWVGARRPRVGRALLTAATAGSLAVAGLGLAVGRSGGELVYVHGAGAAFAPAIATSSPPARENVGDDD